MNESIINPRKDKILMSWWISQEDYEHLMAILKASPNNIQETHFLGKLVEKAFLQGNLNKR
jgi:membrane-bound lytic murein transglycosylase MltF